MGTNFYCRHIPTDNEQKEMQQLLVEKQYEKLKEVLEKSTQIYHIGKRSCGWQFLFQANEHKCRDKYYVYNKEYLVPWECTLESLKEYLSQDNIEIFNEYNEKFTLEQFFNEQVGDSLYNDPKNYINIGQYYMNHDTPQYTINEFSTDDGLRWSTAEFS